MLQRSCEDRNCLNKPNFATMSMSEISEYVRKNSKPCAEMSFQELKEYLLTITDDKEAEKEYVKRSTAQFLAKQKSQRK
ncbi:DUF6887 family protein [Oscillatoria salina]|uniref:DUF6887 family protein n=1 Tax=Oscillatoria salina TaxID=331517 RepID=UPI001CCD92F8|nr:hypothetical protein [Oscillatoria salina]MBZ8180018.1 hypothetical protein [Oscillatoria salina IIICB1]